MYFKIIVLIFLAVILYCLGSGLVYLVKDKGKADRVVKALTWRISLSVILFLLLLLAYYNGWIVPHAV